MTCEQIREQFVDALYNELDAGTRKIFDGHLATCGSCSVEYAKMQKVLSVMDERVREEPDQTGWENYWNKLHAKLTMEDTATSPQAKIFGFRPANMPAWTYAIAATFLLAVGIYVGRTYFNTTHVAETQKPEQVAASAPSSDSTAQEALAYLERSRNLLIGLTNLDEEHHATMDLGPHQKASRKLMEQGNVLTVALNKPDQQLLRQLVQDLQIILLQLANIEVKPGVPGVELVKRGINEKSIILKINLEEMRAMMRQSSTEKTQKKNNNSL